jgi:hypothetical protein
MRRLNPPVLRRQPEVQERQRLQRAERQVVVQLEQERQVVVQLEQERQVVVQLEQEQQELVRPQEPPVLRELLQAPYQLWAQPSQALA